MLIQIFMFIYGKTSGGKKNNVLIFFGKTVIILKFHFLSLHESVNFCQFLLHKMLPIPLFKYVLIEFTKQNLSPKLTIILT